MYKCAIIDDDVFSINILEQLLLSVPDLICIKHFTSPIEALEYLKENTIDILFLDIEMPTMNGFELKKNLSEDIKIIFTTSHSSFALEAYNNGVSDYLVKPVLLSRLNQAIKKVTNEIRTQKNIDSDFAESKTIIVKHKNINHRIIINDILFIESKDEYVYYNTKTEKVIDYARLKNVETILPKEMFIRIHKSFIVNKHYIKSYNIFFVKLENEIELPVGKVWRNQFVVEFIDKQKKES